MIAGVSPPFHPPSTLLSTSPPAGAFSPLSVKEGLWRNTVDRIARDSKLRVEEVIDVQYRLRVLLPTPPFEAVEKRAQQGAAADGGRGGSRENSDDKKEAAQYIFDNFSAGDDGDDGNSENEEEDDGFKEELPFALAQSDLYAVGPFPHLSPDSAGSHGNNANSNNIAMTRYCMHAPQLASFQDTLMIGDIKIDAKAIDHYIRELRQFRDGFS